MVDKPPEAVLLEVPFISLNTKKIQKAGTVNMFKYGMIKQIIHTTEVMIWNLFVLAI